jgi:hypothetical protein
MLPNLGRCCERQHGPAASRVGGANVCCAALQPGLVRGSSGLSRVSFEIARPAAHSPSRSWTALPWDFGLGPRSTTHRQATPFQTLVVWTKDPTTACHEPLTVCPLCTDFFRRSSQLAARRNVILQGTRFCCAQLACALVAAATSPNPSSSGSPTATLTSKQPRELHSPPQPANKQAGACLLTGNLYDSSISISSPATALGHVV